MNNIDFFMCQQVLYSTRSEFFRGNEKKYDLKEIMMDKNEPARYAKAKDILTSISTIDEAVNTFLKQINAIKIKVSPMSPAENSRWMLQDVTKSFPLGMDVLDGKKLVLNQSIIKQYEELKSKILVFRKVLVENAVTKRNGDAVVTFLDPMIDQKMSQIKSRRILDEVLEKGNVSYDDRESIRKLYFDLTKLASVSPSNIKTPGEFLGLLFSIEKGILSSRADSFALMRSRIGGSELITDKMKVFIDCPNRCVEGEEFIVNAYIGAFSESCNPQASINEGIVANIKNGCVTYSVKANSEKEMIVKGNLTTINKSGIPISLPWQRTIQILPK